LGRFDGLALRKGKALPCFVLIPDEFVGYALDEVVG
jgi:hypothetical protein